MSEVVEIAWGDGSSDKIYLTSTALEGNQTVTVSSDANTGLSRTKTVSFATTGSPALTETLTLNQESPYQLLSYITCASKSALITGVVSAETDVLTVDYQITNSSKSGDKHIAACQSGYTGGGIWIETYASSNKWYCRFGSSSSVNGSASTYTSGRHTLTLKKNYFGVDGTQVLTPAYNSMPNTAICFGGRVSSDGTTVTGFWGYLYECSILDSNGNYRWHGIPAKRIADSKVGMFDTVSRTFFTSVQDDFGEPA